ncbi:MAG: biotin--[acetyl-CoA-carboxylase] ligase [Candidatus Lokiarchaeota archaeon]|nr:biotin--[acetyl-CoA-carboxylase] ligase [Candidatus Harpocratesius repetitus]
MIPSVKIIYIDEVSSTQDAIIPYIHQNSNQSIFLIAKTQKHGRGRKNDDWISPIGGFWSTLGIPLPKLLSNEQFVFLHYGIVQLLQSFLNTYLNIPAVIKWPNDLVITFSSNSYRFKKMGGILLELISQVNFNFLLIGIGINLNNSTTNFPDYLKENVVSVFDLTHTKVPIVNFARILLKNLYHEIWESYIVNFPKNKKTLLISQYNQHLLYIGNQITLNNGKKCIINGINDEGELVLNSKNMNYFLKIEDSFRIISYG